jgi:hypothetical protein
MAEEIKENIVVTRIAHRVFSIRAAVLVAVIAAALLVPAAASAQSCAQAGNDPTASQYCTVAGVHAGGNDTSNDGAAGGEVQPVAEVSPAADAAVVPIEATSESGSLPFTGLDVGILALVAVALAGTGLLLRRLTALGDSRS